MTTEVIETKRNPAIWSVKAGQRYKAEFSGEGARERAEAFARKEYGEFAVRLLPPLTRKQWARELIPAK